MSEPKRIVVHDESPSEQNEQSKEEMNQVPEESCCTKDLADGETRKDPDTVDATSIGSHQKDLADGVIRKGPAGASFDSFPKKDLEEEEDKKETKHEEDIEFPVPKSAGDIPQPQYTAWQYHKPLIRGTGSLIGLKNAAHYCYANAVVQLIYHCPLLLECFNKAHFNQDYFEDSSTVTNFSSLSENAHNAMLFEDARRVMVTLDEDNPKEPTPELNTNLLNEVLGDQTEGQDAKEYLDRILSHLQESYDLNMFNEETSSFQRSFKFIPINYDEKILILSQQNEQLEECTKAVPHILRSRTKEYKLRGVVLAMPGHFVTMMNYKVPVIFDDAKVSNHEKLESVPKNTPEFNVDHYEGINDDFHIWIAVYEYTKELTPLNEQKMMKDLMYICENKKMTRSIISILTEAQCNFVLEHLKAFDNPSRSAVAAQIEGLHKNKGLKRLMQMISDPSEALEKKAVYAAIVRQRKVLFDDLLMRSNDDIINEQIRAGLLTQHVFPFSSMTITKTGDIVVTWEPQLNDPAVAMQLGSDGLSLIENFNHIEYPIQRAILYYAFDIKHQTTMFHDKLQEIIKMFPPNEGETEESIVANIKGQVQEWWRKFAKTTKGNGTATFKEMGASQIQTEVEVHYWLTKRRSHCDYHPEGLDRINKSFTCTYEIKLVRGKKTMEGACCFLKEITDPITGQAQLREYILDNSVYVNQDTKIEFINEGDVSFEDAQSADVKIFFNIIESHCIFAYGYRRLHKKVISLPNCIMPQLMPELEKEARRIYNISGQHKVSLIYNSGITK